MATNHGRKREASGEANYPKRLQKSSPDSTSDSSDDSSDEEDVHLTTPSLITYIQNILDNYPDGSQILKELIQNADDAGATEVAFLLDYSSHPCDQLVNPNYSVCQGQALYAWNNAKFTSSDWKGIASLGESCKASDVNKVGRFGQGFVSTYHITDFPIILSNKKIAFLDPHLHLNPGHTGKSFKLKAFFQNSDYSDIQNCFKSYFEYEGESKYRGTIFRFPLRNGNWPSKIKTNGLYGTERVMSTLFIPLMKEAETILIFLKNIKSIKLSIKNGPKEEHKRIFSVKIPTAYMNRIGQLDLSDPIQNLKDKVKIIIRLFPILKYENDLKVKEGVWLVINLIGFPPSPKDLSEFYVKNNIKSYIPWIGMAMETGIELHQLNKVDRRLTYYEYDWVHDDIQSCIQKIISDFKFNLPIPSCYSLNSKSGKLCCFLPTPENSHFPFNMHGYFALSNDRRRIKWPALDSNDPDSKWNQVLIEQLGVSAYVIFYQILVNCFAHTDPRQYHYQFWVVDSSSQSSLATLLVNQGLTLMKENSLVYSHSCQKWISIRSGLYHPNVEGETLHCEGFIEEVLETLKQPLVSLPTNVINIFNVLPDLMSQTAGNIISPSRLRTILKTHCDLESLVSKINSNFQGSIDMLKYVISDLYGNCPNIPSKLENVPLLPLLSSKRTKFSMNQHKPIYIYQSKLNFTDLFPGMNDAFVDTTIPSDVYSFLLELAQKYPNALNLKDISNVKNNAGLLITLFRSSLFYYFKKYEGSLVWNSQISASVIWIESVWKFIGSNQELAKSLSSLPLLPKEKIGSTSNQLLPIVTDKIYIQYSSDSAYQTLEKLLKESGCVFVYKHGFIQCLDSLIIQPLPNGLLLVLERNSFIRQQFANTLLRNQDNVILFKTIVNILNNKCNFTPNQTNIIKQLAIFPNMSNKFISLSQQAVRVPESFKLPSISFHYPNQFISPLYSNVNALYNGLGVASTDLNTFVRDFLIDFMRELRENCKFSDHFILSKLLLKNLSGFSQQLIISLKKFEWIVDSSSNSSVDSGNVVFRKPNDLFDPEDQILSKILPPKSRFFPHCQYSQFSQYTKTLFNSSTRPINQSLFEEVIKAAVIYLKSSINYTNFEQLWRERFIHLLKFANEFIFCRSQPLTLSSVIRAALSNNNIVLPSYRKPSNYPRCLPFLGTKSFHTIGSVVFCNQTEMPLIAGVELCTNEVPEYKTLLSSLNCQVGLTGKMLMAQLDLISMQGCFEPTDVTKIHQILRKIYASPLIHSENTSSKFVFVMSENIFIFPKQIVKDKLPFPLASFYFSFDSLNYNNDAWKLFLKHGASVKLSSQMLYDIVLHKLGEQTDKECDVSNSIDLVSNIIIHLCKNKFHPNDYLLCKDNRLHLATECVFSDSGCTPDSSQTEKDGKVFYLIHDYIPVHVAVELGARSFQLTLLGDEDVFGFCDSVGQYEDLVTRLNNILQQYQSSIDVYKELVQNADDAKATSVKILIDYSTFPSKSILTPSMKTWQGPAVYFYNDSQFSDDDFTNIMKIFGQTKRDDVFKIGKFGLGFNTVYHLTDLPSFVSGRYIHMLDPQMKYIAEHCRQPGIRVNFLNNCENLLTYRDQFRVFNLDLFNCNVFGGEPYNGTVFRLPFRTLPSAISEDIFGRQQIENLTSRIMDDTEDIIRFLQHVTSIEVFKRVNIHSDPVALLKVTKVVTLNPFPAGHSFLSSNDGHFQSIFTGFEVPPISCHQNMTINKINFNQQSETTQHYIVSYASGTKECRNFLMPKEKRINDPFCSISFRTNPVAKISGTTGLKLYCFLPLPSTSLYPWFINGYFELDHSRRGLCRTEDDSQRTEWNKVLIKDALVNALIELLMALQSLVTGHDIDCYYSIWPLEKDNSILWCEFPKSAAIRIIQNNSNSPVFFSDFYSHHWLSYERCHFFTEDAFTICEDLLTFVGEFCALKQIHFVTLPKKFHVKEVFSTILNNDNDKLYDLKRIFQDLLFPINSEIPLKYIELILQTILPYHQESWAYDLLQTQCIPCGILENVKFQCPKKVINPDSKFAELYKPNEMRTPHPSFVHLFKRGNPFYQPLKSLGVIHSVLPPLDVVDRLMVQVGLPEPERFSHCMILIKYLNTHDFKAPDISMICEAINNVDFIPVCRDELFSQLGVQESKKYACPTKCFSFFSRFLITPQHYAIRKDISEMTKFQQRLKIRSEVPMEILVSLLILFHENEKSIVQQNLTKLITERVLKIYNSLDELSTQRDSIKQILSGKNWIWHPDFNKFYKMTEITESNQYERFKSIFLPCFPRSFETAISLDFFHYLGLSSEITIDCVKNVVDEIKKSYQNKPLSRDDVGLILELIRNFYFDISDPALELPYVLSASNTLRPVSELVRDDMPWKRNNCSDRSKLAHPLIPLICLHNLKVPSSRSRLYTNVPFQVLAFGQFEDISTRIDNFKKDCPNDSTILKEFLQNAEDACATEFSIILDHQTYPADSLCFPVEDQPNLAEYQKCPSLLIYNNRAFTPKDLEGIQSVGLGGKQYRQTIGKFGLGFNAVYHLTDSPCLLTRRRLNSGEFVYSYCIFDPYRKYLKNSTSEPPGIRLDLTEENFSQFSDQFKPFSLSAILSNPSVRKNSFSDLNDGEFSLFRIPFFSDNQMPYRVKRIISDFFDQVSEISLFLEVIQNINFFEISSSGYAKRCGNLTCKPIHHIPLETSQFPQTNQGCVQISLKRVHTEIENKILYPTEQLHDLHPSLLCPNQIVKYNTWLIYNYKGHLQGLESVYPDLKQFKSKYKNEKLSHSIYGGLAIKIPNDYCEAFDSIRKGFIYSYLPLGNSSSHHDYPVQINAPFIVDAHRQFLKFQSSETDQQKDQQWHDAWHTGILKHVLVPLYATLLIDLRSGQSRLLREYFSEWDIKHYFEWYYSLFPDMELLEKGQKQNYSFLFSLSKELFSWLCQSHPDMLICENYSQWYSFSGENQGVFKSLGKADYSVPLYPILSKLEYPLTAAPEHIAHCLTKFNCNVQRVEELHFLQYFTSYISHLMNDQCFPTSFDNFVLSFEEIVNLLHFLFNATNEVIAKYGDIPLKVDQSGNISSFSKSPFTTFDSEYVQLLPDCKSRFYDNKYPPGIITLLTNARYIKKLPNQFLIDNLKSELLPQTGIILFWRYAIKCLPMNVLLQKFGEHRLVPVKRLNCINVEYLQISQLHCCILNPKQKNKQLYNPLYTLGCPVLMLDTLVSIPLGVNSCMLHNYLDPPTNTIHNSIGYDDALNALSLANPESLENVLTSKDALCLRNLVLRKKFTYNNQELNIFSLLKIFLTSKNIFVSVKDCKNCYINCGIIPIGSMSALNLSDYTVLLDYSEGEKHKLEELLRFRTVNILNFRSLFLECILPQFLNIQLSHQQALLACLENNNDAVIIEKLKPIPFIAIGNVFLPVCQLYNPRIELFRVFYPFFLIPLTWIDSCSKIMCQLGLQYEEDLDTIKECAMEVSSGSYGTQSNAKNLLPLKALIELINKRSVAISSLDQFLNIRFIPQWKYAHNFREEYRLGCFSDANLHAHSNCCCTVSWIHSSHILKEDLKQFAIQMKQTPDTSEVVEHIKTLSASFNLALGRLGKPLIVTLFTSSYTHLGGTDTPWTIHPDTPCILYKEKLYMARNMVFEIKDEIVPYLFKVPHELTDFHDFLRKIGVQEVPSHEHYTAVMGDISNLTQTEVKNLGEKTFLLFVTLLRELESTNQIVFQLDLSRVLLFTQKFIIVPRSAVLYIDNTKLMVHLNQFPVLLNLELLHELPPNVHGSCEPPKCLQMTYLSSIIKESLTNTTRNGYFNSNTSQQIQKILRSNEFMNGLIRIYYHETKSNGKDNLKFIKIKDKTVDYDSDEMLDSSYKSVFQILSEIKVVAVQSINIEVTCLKDGTQLTRNDIYQCFKENAIIYTSYSGEKMDIFRDLTTILNSCLGGIFSQNLFYLQSCLTSDKITEVLNSFNISQCPHIDHSTLPVAASSSSSHSHGGMTRTRLLQKFHTPNRSTMHIPPPSTPSHPFSTAPAPPSLHPVIPTTSIEITTTTITTSTPLEDDKHTAQLWIRTAQCDLRAAQKLIHKCENDPNVFASHACFHCFDCAIKACISIICLKRFYKVNISTERNLDIIIELIKQFFPQNEDYLSLLDLCLPLMNYHEVARDPCMTPGIGCCIPIQCYPLEAAEEAISNATNVLKLIRSSFPQIGELMFTDQDKVWGCPPIKSLLKTQLENFQIRSDIDFEILSEDCLEYYAVARNFLECLYKAEIVNIKKIHNLNCWTQFKRKVELKFTETSSLSEGSLLIKPLFHGSSNTNPDKILKSPQGFQIKYSRVGLWGKGIYFATTAAYSHGFAHRLSGNQYCIFMAKVFVGNSKKLPEDNNLTSPPLGYHSVNGVTNGTKVYILYEDCLAYPSYLITYNYP